MNNLSDEIDKSIFNTKSSCEIIGIVESFLLHHFCFVPNRIFFVFLFPQASVIESLGSGLSPSISISTRHFGNTQSAFGHFCIRETDKLEISLYEKLEAASLVKNTYW